MTRSFTHAALILAAAAILAPALLAGQTPRHADLCVFRGGRFLCDTAHDGGAAEVRVRFGAAGELPFLVDFDGDGRDDPCVFRDRQFLCDTVHDGGAAERQTARFNSVPAGAQPLLGDVDGDLDQGGTVDPCYRLGSRWTCLVFSGAFGTIQVFWDFGSGTDPGLLGDVDGDGDADSCVFQQGRFFCRVFREQDGTLATLTLNLRSALPAGAPGTPLLGDVNGDGRADPCVWNAGRLVCGIFPPGKNRPASIVRQSFGNPGDVPVLGDIDGL
jgi:FG-GAP-like repeat